MLGISRPFHRTGKPHPVDRTFKSKNYLPLTWQRPYLVLFKTDRWNSFKGKNGETADRRSGVIADFSPACTCLIASDVKRRLTLSFYLHTYSLLRLVAFRAATKFLVDVLSWQIARWCPSNCCGQGSFSSASTVLRHVLSFLFLTSFSFFFLAALFSS